MYKWSVYDRKYGFRAYVLYLWRGENKMRILYQSSLCTENVLEDLYKASSISPGIQAQKYNKLIVEGLNSNDQEIYAFTSLPISRSISKKIFHYRKKETKNSIHYL